MNYTPEEYAEAVERAQHKRKRREAAKKTMTNLILVGILFTSCAYLMTSSDKKTKAASVQSNTAKSQQIMGWCARDFEAIGIRLQRIGIEHLPSHRIAELERDVGWLRNPQNDINRAHNCTSKAKKWTKFLDKIGA